MAKQPSYADALKILGKNDSEVLDMAEKLADGGLGALGVPDLFGIRSMVVGKGRRALEGMRGKLKGESRLSRTEKILAAERLLIVVSFFEAAGEAWEQVGMPFPMKDLEITGEERIALVEGIMRPTGRVVPYLTDRWSEENPEGLSPPDFHAMETEELFDDLVGSFVTMVAGLAVTEAHGITDVRDPLLDALGSRLEHVVVLRHQEHRRALAADIPEFAMWTREQEDTRTRHRWDTGLAEVGRRLDAIASDRPVARRRTELSALHRSVLRRPVLPSDDTVRDLVLPSLEEAYIPPRGRITLIRSHAVPSSESWWQETTGITQDLEGFIAAHLVHPQATAFPTVVLGHPGAGKSKFTEVLAARLPAADFLPIRVELRSVPPNAPIHAQIEQGLTHTLNAPVSWRELADCADGALPVIILDGFDELLQATGVDRSDYLERVHEFQQQQEAMERPVVVIVTSRTVVADRARFPHRTTVIKLEPFDEARIDRFLRVWNTANGRGGTGAETLTTEAVLRYRDLAEQPLLLAMLLVYDARDHALRRTGDRLTHGELYERLLTMFAAREVRKHRSSLDQHDFDRAVEDELRRLEVTALAMFTRRRQYVTAEELDRDLDVLMPGAVPRPSDTAPHGRIAPSHQVLGRFFFVHEARARVAEGTARTYEFLHATFGEYLVARAVVAALDRLRAFRSLALRQHGWARSANDGELYALLSFACLPGREKVVDFLTEGLEKRFREDTGLRTEYSKLLLDLFQASAFPAADRSHGAYEPARSPITTRQGNYTANLVVLLVLVREDAVDLHELFPDVDRPLPEWRDMAGLWRSLHSSEWFAFLNTVRVRYLDAWDPDRRRTVISRDRGEPVNVGECVGFELYTDLDVRPDVLDPYEVTSPFRSTASRMLRSTAMRVNGTNARTVLGLLPYLHRISEELGSWFTDDDGRKAWLEVHEVLRLRLETPGHDPDARLVGYRRLLSTRRLGRLELVALRQAAEDARWPSDTGGMEPLRRTVRDYLSAVRSVSPRPTLSREAIRPILESFPTGFLPNGMVDRILDLADAAHRTGDGEKGRRRVPIVISPPGSGEH
ncbi:NACHT domain-containing protein [Nocardiopsis lambiniae]|uniref:NACHT N-terminal Helical domain-containing protein n=1 Tax=Nocardiopsis lambiniae TaxID=3075539 RepID=A0ABU2MBF5_9ACTN|nr:hypothetical protein [Nocardiopsis sp. DSM 44743]MDT0329947.1 hypothetical protein [Nocardiopsis sp. DSM 44743]